MAIYMGWKTLSRERSSGLHPLRDERRKNPRFDMRLPVILRSIGDPWGLSVTADISATGATFLGQRPFLLGTPIEYVLTFPPELTKASRPLRMRCLGVVLRCHETRDGDGAFGIAVRSTSHRYLTLDEAAAFDAIERNLSAAA